MNIWFSYCPNCGLESHATEKEASDNANRHLEHYREDAPDGWSDEVNDVCWGEIKEVVKETERRAYNPDTDYGIDPSCDYVVDYALCPVVKDEK